MTLSVTSLREDSGDDIFYTEDFRRMIEQHRIYLQTADGYDHRLIPEGEAWRWRYDFYGLLGHLNIPEYLRWIYLRVNDMINPADYSGLNTTILIPSITAIQNLTAIFRNQYSTS